MEPLDVAATDWIKDYDPLFELFDEEMQMGSADTTAVAAANHTWPTAMVPCDATYYTPISDYYYTAASFAASAQPMVQQYHTTPTATSTTSYASQSADGYDLSQYYNQQYHHQVATVAQPCMTANATTSTQTDSYVKLDQHQNHHQQQHQHQQQQQQQEEIQPPTQQTDEWGLFFGLDWLPCLENELPETSATSSSSSTPPTISSAPVTPAITQLQSESTSSSSSSSSSAYSSAAPSPTATSPPCDTVSALSKGSSKKRKATRSKGISLLAQPSPKVINVAVSNNVTSPNNSITNTSCSITTTLPVQITTTTSTQTPTSTRLLTTKNVPILKLSRTASLQQATNVVGFGTTTTTATLVTYSNIANVVRQTPSMTLAAPITNTATASKKTATNSADYMPIAKTARQLSKLELTNKLCASIEHNYALAPS